jgi:ABC-type lipoprotein release transport system permease subunit
MTILLLLVSVAASSMPAYRAAGVDPIETLREQ